MSDGLSAFGISTAGRGAAKEIGEFLISGDFQ